MSLLYGGDDRQRRQSCLLYTCPSPRDRYKRQAWKNDTVYLHSGPEGSKVEMVVRHPQVCINFCEGHELVYMHKQVACSYSMKSRSVICKGKVRFIEDMNEKRRILDMLMKQYTDNECSYAEPAVRNVKIWEVKVDEISCRSFGLRPSEVK